MYNVRWNLFKKKCYCILNRKFFHKNTIYAVYIVVGELDITDMLLIKLIAIIADFIYDFHAKWLSLFKNRKIKGESSR